MGASNLGLQHLYQRPTSRVASAVWVRACCQATCASCCQCSTTLNFSAARQLPLARGASCDPEPHFDRLGASLPLARGASCDPEPHFDRLGADCPSPGGHPVTLSHISTVLGRPCPSNPRERTREGYACVGACKWA
eukprot:363626-Chlamydomonas_euryale.AAC.4